MSTTVPSTRDCSAAKAITWLSSEARAEVRDSDFPVDCLMTHHVVVAVVNATAIRSALQRATGVDKTRVLGYTANTPRETAEAAPLPPVRECGSPLCSEFGSTDTCGGPGDRLGDVIAQSRFLGK
jgi:hypothetical protein